MVLPLTCLRPVYDITRAELMSNISLYMGISIGSYSTMTMEIKSEGTKRTIKHFWFQEWLEGTTPGKPFKWCVWKAWTGFPRHGHWNHMGEGFIQRTLFHRNQIKICSWMKTVPHTWMVPPICTRNKVNRVFGTWTGWVFMYGVKFPRRKYKLHVCTRWTLCEGPFHSWFRF